MIKLLTILALILTPLSAFAEDPPGTPEPGDPVCRPTTGSGDVSVVCLGDSNTVPNWFAFESWCQRLEPFYEVTNCAWGGSTAMIVEIPGHPFTGSPYHSGLLQLEASPDADIVVIATGTSDIFFFDRTPEQAAESILFIYNQAILDGYTPVIGLTTPYNHATNPEKDLFPAETNAIITAAIPPRS
jgi:hypothetical protein